VVLRDVFLFYQEHLKPLYCEIQAKGNEIPSELLFEIHAAFDHLKRFYVEEEEEDACCKRAIGHLKRAALDAFKIKLRNFHTDVEHLLRESIDFELIDNGSYLPRMIAAKSEIATLALRARKSEGHGNIHQAFDPWYDTSLKIDEFYHTYLDDGSKFAWARKKTFSYFNKDTKKGAALGFATGVASSLVVWWMTLPESAQKAAHLVQTAKSWISKKLG
jgi:hypothetical protein